uniref:Microtubule-associated protein Jupiter n=1 Tax=Steinernema glaseri TaxID=37863 RepID=A0A1I7Y540_9BILA
IRGDEYKGPPGGSRHTSEVRQIPKANPVTLNKNSLSSSSTPHSTHP